MRRKTSVHVDDSTSVSSIYIFDEPLSSYCSLEHRVNLDQHPQIMCLKDSLSRIGRFMLLHGVEHKKYIRGGDDGRTVCCDNTDMNIM